MIIDLRTTEMQLTNTDQQNVGDVLSKANMLCQDLEERAANEIDNEGCDDILLLLMEYNKLLNLKAQTSTEEFEKLQGLLGNLLLNKHRVVTPGVEAHNEDDTAWVELMDPITTVFGDINPDAEQDQPRNSPVTDDDWTSMLPYIETYRASLLTK